MRGCSCRDHMVVGFTTTYAISVYHHLIVSLNPVDGEVYLIQHYVIKCLVAGQWFFPGTPGGGNRSALRKSPTCHKSLTNFIQ